MEQIIATVLVIVGTVVLIIGTWATAKEAVRYDDDEQSTTRRDGEHDPR